MILLLGFSADQRNTGSFDLTNPAREFPVVKLEKAWVFHIFRMGIGEG